MAAKKKTTKKAARKTAKAKEITPASSGGELATSLASSIVEDSGGDFKGAGADEFTIPRLKILADLSKETKPKEDVYIDGAQPGHVLNTLSKELIDCDESPLYFIPFWYARTFLEWLPARKGFVASHGNVPDIMSLCEYDENARAQVVQQEDTRFTCSKGNLIIPTLEYAWFIVDIETGTYEPVMVSMAKSQYKKGKDLNSVVRNLVRDQADFIPGAKGQFNPAMFFSVFSAITVPESNDEGDWWGWKMERHSDTLDLPNGPEIYEAAKRWRDNMVKGNVKAQGYEEDDTSSGGSRRSSGGGVDDESPM